MLTAKQLKEWLVDIPDNQVIEVRLKGGWITEYTTEYTLRAKSIKLLGHSEQSQQTAADDE